MKQGSGSLRLAALVVMVLGGSSTVALAQQPSKEAALLASGGAGAISQPSKEEALRAVGGALVEAPAAGVSACSLCYTCGGDWPVFSGVIPTRSGASPLERGSACSGSLTPMADTGPYLCCRP